MISCGHGSALTRQFTDGLLAAGLPRVVTDPDPSNHRAAAPMRRPVSDATGWSTRPTAFRF